MEIPKRKEKTSKTGGEMETELDSGVNKTFTLIQAGGCWGRTKKIRSARGRKTDAGGKKRDE